jgi:hypothetical protein
LTAKKNRIAMFATRSPMATGSVDVADVAGESVIHVTIADALLR